MFDNVGGVPTFRASGPMAQWSLVKLNSGGQLELANAADTNAVGAVTEEVFEAGQLVGVRARNLGGTHQAIAAGAIAVGDEVTQVDGGTLESGGAGTSAGFAIMPAATGEHFAFMPN